MLTLKAESDAKYMIKKALNFLPLGGGTLTGNLTIKKGTHEGTFSLSGSGVVAINTAAVG